MTEAISNLKKTADPTSNIPDKVNQDSTVENTSMVDEHEAEIEDKSENI